MVGFTHPPMPFSNRRDFAFIFVFLLILFFLTIFLSRQEKASSNLIRVFFYLSGSVISLLIVGRSVEFPLIIHLTFFVVSIVLIVLYLAFDWRLARAAPEPTGKDPGRSVSMP
jgi:cytochrome c oxidase assembly factor CtaG